jgi:hypothetical protein
MGRVESQFLRPWADESGVKNASVKSRLAYGTIASIEKSNLSSQAFISRYAFAAPASTEASAELSISKTYRSGYRALVIKVK